jgi:branched-chain amino acid transport system ATP-binding protein
VNVDEMPTGEAPATAMDAFSLRDVTLTFGGVRALDSVSFDLADGDVVGMIGPNGAGKTSLMNCMTGFYRPTGSIKVLGREVVGRSTLDVTALGVARTFQQAESLSGMGAMDVLLLGRERFMPRGILRYAFGVFGARRSEYEAKEYAMTIAEELGVEGFVGNNTAYENLPYGTRKLIDLGRALACEPRVLLMDEPAAGLSPDEKEVMIAAIRRIEAERGITQLLVDHDIRFVSTVASRLVVLDAGRLIADGSIDAVLADPKVIESYIGMDDEEGWDETFAIEEEEVKEHAP